MNGHKQKPIAYAGIAFGILFTYLALRETHFPNVWQALERAHFWLMVPLLAVYGIFFWLKAVRWRMLLGPVCQTTTKAVFPPMMVGFMGNNVLPAHLGEFVRMYFLSRQLRVKNTPVAATIVLERLFDFLAVLLFLCLVVLIGGSVPETLVMAGYFAGGACVVLLGGICFLAYRTEACLSFFSKSISFLQIEFRRKLIEQVALGAQGLHAIKGPGLLVGISATSILQWMLVGIALYISFVAFQIAVPISAGFVTLAFIVAGLTLPTSPGFFGTIQLCFTLALRPYGVDPADAFAASVFYHTLTYLPVTLIGFYYLNQMGYTLQKVREEVEAERREGPAYISREKAS